MFGIKRRFQRCKAWPLGSRSPPYERIKFAYPLQNARLLLLSTNLAREWLQIDTDLLRIITSTVDSVTGYQHRWPWMPLNFNIGGFSEFFAICVCDARLEWIFADITRDRLRQPAYKIKLMLSRVSWALAQISCRWLLKRECALYRVGPFQLRQKVPYKLQNTRYLNCLNNVNICY